MIKFIAIKNWFPITKMARKTYYKNLDTIRFIAAFFVIIYHWFPQKIGDFPLAKIGVDIFFVLSGFLITEILLNEKVKQKNKSTILIAFYIKRSIRIFPIYFLFLLFFYYYNYPDLGKNWIYFFT